MHTASVVATRNRAVISHFAQGFFVNNAYAVARFIMPVKAMCGG